MQTPRCLWQRRKKKKKNKEEGERRAALLLVWTGEGYFAAAAAKDGRHHFFSFPSKEKKRFRASKEEKGACWEPVPRKPRVCIASAMRRLSAGTTFPYAEMPATRLGIKKGRKTQGFSKSFGVFLNERRTSPRAMKDGARPVAGDRGESNTAWKTAFFLFVEKPNSTKDCNN